MPKLSRLEKNKASRQAAVETTASIQSEKPLRQAAPGKSSHQSAQSASESSGVLRNVLGEVYEYNAEHGNTVASDSSMNILYEISDDTEMDSKRNEHLETMETNESAGGTTRNIYASDLESVSRAAAKAGSASAADIAVTAQSTSEPAASEVVLGAADYSEAEPFILYSQIDQSIADSAADASQYEAGSSKDEASEKKKAKKKHSFFSKGASKAKEEETEPEVQKSAPAAEVSAVTEAAPVQESEDEADSGQLQTSSSKGSTAVNVILSILCIALVAAIIYILYIISSLGVFG